MLDEIIKIFKDEDSLVLYFSDHGEEVCDVDDFSGHVGTRISRFMLEVPFVLYLSNTFKQEHEDFYKRIKNTDKSVPYMLDDLTHTLADIAGGKILGYEEKRSIFSSDDSFLRARKRVVGEKPFKDYDKELKKF